LTSIQERAMEELGRTRKLINEVAKISTPEERNVIITDKGVKWVKTKIQVIKDVRAKGYICGIKRLSDETGMGVPEAARMICGWFGVSPADSWLDEPSFAARLNLMGEKEKHRANGARKNQYAYIIGSMKGKINHDY